MHARSLHRLAGTLTRAAVGSGVDRRVLPIAAVSLVYSASFATFWVYVGIFAVRGLHWPSGRVGLLFLASAPVAAAANYLSGRVSDRTGRRRLIVVSFLGSALNMLALRAFGGSAPLAFVLICGQGVVGAPAFSLHRVLVADLVEDDAREQAYATLRVAANLGTIVGPPLAALLLSLGGWTSFLLGNAALGALGAVLAASLLPHNGKAVAVASGSTSVRPVLRDRPFLLLLASTLLTYFDYCGFETVLPVIAVVEYGLSPATWGLVIAVGPALVILGQLRLMRVAQVLETGPRLAAAALLMGLPFLAFIASRTMIVVVAVVVAFFVGEMVWQPTSQSLAAQLASAPKRGAYLGAFAAMTGPAWTLAPFVAFKLRAHAGVDAVWMMLAGIAVAAAFSGYAAVRAAAAAATR